MGGFRTISIFVCINCNSSNHLATNLASAPQLTTQVLDYPIRSEVPTETHKPVIVTMKG